MSVLADNFGLVDFEFPADSSAFFDLYGFVFTAPATGVCDYPDEGDVRAGVVYGDGLYVGTLTVVTSGDPSDDVVAYSPADVCRRLMISLGYGLNPPSTPWPMFENNEPNSPDEVITWYDTSSQVDGREMVAGEVDYHYGIQVRVRAGDKPTAYSKVEEIRDRMARDVYDVVVLMPNGLTYLVHCFSKIGAVLRIGKEQGSKRHLYTINALVTLRKL